MKYSLNSLIVSKKKHVDLYSILKLLYGISDLEIKILDFLQSKQKEISKFTGICINTLSKELGKDRSLIQRCLKKLREIGMVKREKKTLSEYIKICKVSEINIINFDKNVPRGYLYIYRVLPKKDLKEKLMITSQNGFSLLERAINHM